MEIFSFDQLTTIYRWTRWLPAVLGILTALTTVFNFYLSDRITDQKEEDHTKTKARLETAEKQISSAHAMADAAKMMADQLKEAARPRQLTDDQKTKIITHLKNGEKTTVEIQCIVNNDEAWKLAEQIKSTFETAGFSFDRIVPIINAPPLKGIRVRIKQQPSKGMDKAIAELLHSQGQPLTVERAAEETANITIQIGQK